MNLEELKAADQAPWWMKDAGFGTISKGYMLENETPRAMYERVAMSSCKHGSYNETMKEEIFDIMYNKNWLCPATPVLSNLGTERGLPISCFGLSVEDNMQDIMGRGIGELGALTKAGGGVGVGLDKLRPRGSLIKGGKNGKTEGVVPFSKVYDSAIMATKQGTTRRGAASLNLNIDHGDWHEFIRIRRPEGDINRQCPNIHQCSTIHDEFMNRVESGELIARQKWTELMRTRMETGESYILWLDNVNKNNPDAYKNQGLEVDMTNICSEITLYTDRLHSFICCLSSLNLSRWDEWKNWKSKSGFTLPELATYFLNGVLDEFIDKGQYVEGLENTIRSAIKGRAIGIGALGWHTYLQEHNMPFFGYATMSLNNEIFSFIDENAKKASKALVEFHGFEPEWCKGTGMYNTHLTAIAPTRSNSTISGELSAGIEPIIANAYTDVSAKGTFIRYNESLKKILIKYDQDEKEVWKSITNNYGSVQHLDFLSDDEKKVFLTAYEIDQNVLVQQAAQRQKYICQSQSLNLFFSSDVNPKYFNDVHLNAWRLGIKSLYYCRSLAGIKVNVDAECLNCEG